VGITTAIHLRVDLDLIARQILTIRLIHVAGARMIQRATKTVQIATLVIMSARSAQRGHFRQSQVTASVRMIGNPRQPHAGQNQENDLKRLT
jgi:hypothetical protein